MPLRLQLGRMQVRATVGGTTLLASGETPHVAQQLSDLAGPNQLLICNGKAKEACSSRFEVTAVGEQGVLVAGSRQQVFQVLSQRQRFVWHRDPTRPWIFRQSLLAAGSYLLLNRRFLSLS